jgi:hypothetical protein
MARQKPVQQGVRVRLPKGATWELAEMSPEQVRERMWPPASSRSTPESSRRDVIPKFEIDELKSRRSAILPASISIRFARSLLPEFPAPIFLTTRPDLGDVSKGKRVTIDNFWNHGVLNPNSGLRLLLTPFRNNSSI